MQRLRQKPKQEKRQKEGISNGRINRTRTHCIPLREILGTLQVDQEGSIANWTIPGKLVPGMGGAMDLCAGVKKIIVATDHCEKNGQSKILKKCTLPLTGYQCVTDIVTERCYFEVTPEGLVLREVAPGYTVEDILACTDADVIVPDEVGVMQ